MTKYEKDILKKIEEYTKANNIFVKRLLRYNYESGSNDICIVYNGDNNQKVKDLIEYVWDINKDDTMFGVYIISLEQALERGIGV